MFNATAGARQDAVVAAGAEQAVNSSTALFLALLPELYAPLSADMCAWLAVRGVAVDELACEPPSNTTTGRLPKDVCERLAVLSAPVNSTACLKPAPSLDNEDVIRASLLAVLAVLSFFGNCYTIHSIRNKASPAPVYKLIMHLSVADVVVSLVCIAGEAIWMFMVQWTFGNVACKVWKFLEMTALHGSSYVVVLIAQNRWVAVNHPLASRRHKSSVCDLVRDVVRCASPRSVLLVWVVGACLSIPQLMMFSVQLGPFYEEYYQCVTYDMGSTLERVYNIVNFMALFVIPLLGLIISYLSIYCTLSKGQREIRSVDKISIATHDQNRQRSMKRAMVKSRWIAVVIVCAYLVSWLPYYITMLVHFLSPSLQDEADPTWMGWIFFCGMANSVINPAIYGMFQLWKPKRRKQWSCFRHRDGSTQLTQFTDSFRRHGAIGMAPIETAIPVGDSNGGPPPAPTLQAQQPQPGQADPTATPPPKPPSPTPPPPPPAAPTPAAEAAAETTLTLIGNSVKTPERVLGAERPIITSVVRKAAPFSWRNKFLRKYRALRAHTAQHAHI